MLVMSGLIIFGQAANEASDWIRIWGIMCFGLVVIAAVLMNAYPVRYLHLGRFMSRHPWFARLTLLLSVAVFTPYFGHMPAADYQLFVVDMRAVTQDDPALAIGILLDSIDSIHGDQGTAVDAHETVAKLGLQRLE